MDPDFGIVISYRREDTGGYAGRLYDQLATHFGEENVFIDIDAIPLGVDWVEHIESTLERCDVLLALIGRHWLTVTDDRGDRRIDDPDDFLRREIESALDRGDVRVIPVRLQGAQVPRHEDLPEALAGLPRRQSYRIDDDRWHRDVQALMEALVAFRAEKDAALGKSHEEPEEPSVGERIAADPKVDEPHLSPLEVTSNRDDATRQIPASADVEPELASAALSQDTVIAQEARESAFEGQSAVRNGGFVGSQREVKVWRDRRVAIFGGAALAIGILVVTLILVRQETPTSRQGSVLLPDESFTYIDKGGDEVTCLRFSTQLMTTSGLPAPADAFTIGTGGEEYAAEGILVSGDLVRLAYLRRPGSDPRTVSYETSNVRPSRQLRDNQGTVVKPFEGAAVDFTTRSRC